MSKFLLKFGRGVVGSKQAFSQARAKLKWEAFVDLNDTFIKGYYTEGGVKRYKNRYLLLATDGSDYELPYEKELISAFGVCDNGQTKQAICMAKGVKIWDILNRITVSSYLGAYDVVELDHFKIAWRKAYDLLHDVAKTALQAQILLLGDMHYPSFWLTYYLMQQKTQFLFRCPPTFCREIIEFMASVKQDTVLTIAITGDKTRYYRFKRQLNLQKDQVPSAIQIRAIKFVRPNGEMACLLTSVAAQELSYQDIVDLYPYRWGEEVSYHFDKNVYEVENFAGKTPLSIRQEWYANTLNANFVQLIIEQAQEQLDEEQKNKDNKYQYQINRSVAYGLLKDEIPKVLFEQESIQSFCDRWIPIILKHRVPIKPMRSTKRQKKHKLKFSMNSRRVI